MKFTSASLNSKTKKKNRENKAVELVWKWSQITEENRERNQSMFMLQPFLIIILI